MVLRFEFIFFMTKKCNRIKTYKWEFYKRKAILKGVKLEELRKPKGIILIRKNSIILCIVYSISLVALLNWLIVAKTLFGNKNYPMRFCQIRHL